MQQVFKTLSSKSTGKFGKVLASQKSPVKRNVEPYPVTVNKNVEPYPVTVNKNTFAKFFYKRNPSSTIRQLKVEIEPINPDGKTDKRIFGLREGEIFHNTTIGSDGNFKIFGKDVTLDQDLLEKIKLRVYRKRGRFGPEEAQQQGEEHHAQEVRTEKLDNFLEIFYYPVKCLMEWITSKNLTGSFINMTHYKEVNNKYFYTVNIRVDDDDDDEIVEFNVEVSGQFNEISEGQINQLSSPIGSNMGGYKKRRKISKRRRVSKRRKLSKRKKLSKRRNNITF